MQRRKEMSKKYPLPWKALGGLEIIMSELETLRALEATKKELAELHTRLMVGGGEPSVKACYEYSDTLVSHDGKPRFGDLSRLEWMLRTVVGYSRLQDKYIKKLEAKIHREAAGLAGLGADV